MKEWFERHVVIRLAFRQRRQEFHVVVRVVVGLLF
jgi:hypothetical protein